ncbi:fumarate reductase flavoprotein subunit [Jatrophihabitans endophyticus]|uniref:Fumarate reductase flavoprotein subunit n=1 Tax=Jatrophihabitans endophyticus TaxID=1206085 RepID=A0A1M5M0L4_9ACTN|nr:FAD-binding protein [Jatrophihabitans endophyticus]SHG70469.1 fumarate reductase flavoprotein subunit [Jatrophihabitans endophyticus]
MSAGGPDLVVAGAGGGLVAALRAAELGLDVLVVEASTHYRRGNNTSMSTAMIPGCGSRFQRDAGIEDSVELFVADVERKTKGAGDLELAGVLGRVSAELVEWLADHVGLPISVMTDMHYPGHSVDRCHTIPSRHGSDLVDALARAVADHPRVDLLAPARLTDVHVEDGRVVGCTVAQPDGTSERIATDAVLLATNGYGADRDLVAEHLPDIAAAHYHGSETSRGDALRIGRALGAATGYLDAYQGHGALSSVATTLVGWATIMHGGVMLDLAGHRFADESTGYSEFGPTLAAQPGAAGWIVIDRRIHELCQPFTDYRQTAESGAVRWAGDGDALAAVLDVPAASLAVELRDVEAVARGERADPFGRTDFEAPLAPPYAAVRVVPALFHTQGGLRVDEHAAVRREDGTVIPGLYASGGAAAGISGHGAAGYLAGNGLLPALGLAYLAAGDVAARRDAPAAAR